MDGGADADGEAVGRHGEGHVHVDADGVGAGALGVGEELGIADPVVRLLVEDLVRGALVGAGVEGRDDRVLVGGLRGSGIDRADEGAGTGAETQVFVDSSRAARVGGRSAVMSSRPETAVEPRGVSTRVA